MAWFKKTRKPIKSNEKASRVPEGLWVKCPSCGRAIYNKELGDNQQVCTKCGHHFRMSAAERLKLLFDGALDRTRRGAAVARPAQLHGHQALQGTAREQHQSHRAERRGHRRHGHPGWRPVVIASMEYSFIGGSMGVVVGEKITRGAEIALASSAPLIVVSCSGGARMMEGALSLMQMAKISAALGRLDRAGLPYLSILTDPTTGGVTASFAMLGDLNIAEPKALIGFAGPRVIEQTIRQKLPAGFQRSEFLVEKGFLDLVDRPPRAEGDDRAIDSRDDGLAALSAQAAGRRRPPRDAGEAASS